MLRQKWVGTLLVLATLVPFAVPAQALPLVSFRLAGTVGAQSQEVELDLAGLENYNGTSAVVLYGAEAGVGLPMGIHVFGHYYRHTNEYGEDLIDDMAYDAFVDMSGNEWGLDLEWHLSLIPASPIKPYLGAGGSWARVNLDGEVRFEGASAALTTETDIYRLYALAGLKLGGVIDVTVRGGMSLGDEEAAAASYTLAGQDVSISANYQGYFVAASAGIGF